MYASLKCVHGRCLHASGDPDCDYGALDMDDPNAPVECVECGEECPEDHATHYNCREVGAAECANPQFKQFPTNCYGHFVCHDCMHLASKGEMDLLYQPKVKGD